MARQPLGLKERQRILELARQGLSAQQIAQIDEDN
jgi:DNA-binding CsgD family transcriptional regulator